MDNPSEFVRGDLPVPEDVESVFEIYPKLSIRGIGQEAEPYIYYVEFVDLMRSAQPGWGVYVVSKFVGLAKIPQTNEYHFLMQNAQDINDESTIEDIKETIRVRNIKTIQTSPGNFEHYMANRSQYSDPPGRMQDWPIKVVYWRKVSGYTPITRRQEQRRTRRQPDYEPPLPSVPVPDYPTTIPTTLPRDQPAQMTDPSSSFSPYGSIYRRYFPQGYFPHRRRS